MVSPQKRVLVTCSLSDAGAGASVTSSGGPLHRLVIARHNRHVGMQRQFDAPRTVAFGKSLAQGLVDRLDRLRCSRGPRHLNLQVEHAVDIQVED